MKILDVGEIAGQTGVPLFSASEGPVEGKKFLTKNGKLLGAEKLSSPLRQSIPAKQLIRWQK
jgi:hypothetical protein